MNTRFSHILLLVLFLGQIQARADEFDSQSFLGMTSGNSVGAAITRGEKSKKRVLVFAYDEKKKNQAFHIKGMLELEETKKLVRQHFILVITDFKDRNIRDVIGSEGTERPMYFLFNPDGSLVQKGTAAVGPSVGAKLVKEWTSK
ncbi:MAG: hypothetical protein OJI67_24130 [Prosthecobacter sp.]|nr:hypothetical protein [Prosthecobacter sp.]